MNTFREISRMARAIYGEGWMKRTVNVPQSWFCSRNWITLSTATSWIRGPRIRSRERIRSVEIFGDGEGESRRFVPPTREGGGPFCGKVGSYFPAKLFPSISRLRQVLSLSLQMSLNLFLFVFFFQMLATEFHLAEFARLKFRPLPDRLRSPPRSSQVSRDPSFRWVS